MSKLATDLPCDLDERLAPWQITEILRPLPGGARCQVALVRKNRRFYVAKSTSWSDPGLRWVAKLQSIGQRCGLNLAPYIAAHSGRYAPGGWTLEPYVAGTAARSRDLRALSPALRRLHAATRDWQRRPGQDRLWAPPIWRALHEAHQARWPQSAIHGDVGPGNVVRADTGQLVLLDWDEARCGPSALDLPTQRETCDGQRERLHLVVEIARGWHAEPDYARRLARRHLLTRPAAPRNPHRNIRSAPAFRS